jgi:hypothetical protein
LQKDFLKEELTTAQGNEFYKTDAGIQQLAVGTYYQVFEVPTNGNGIIVLLIMERMNFMSVETRPIHPGTIMIQLLIPHLLPMVICKESIINGMPYI